jgi:hypothetical protein
MMNRGHSVEAPDRRYIAEHSFHQFPILIQADFVGNPSATLVKRRVHLTFLKQNKQRWRCTLSLVQINVTLSIDFGPFRYFSKVIFLNVVRYQIKHATARK